MNTVKNSIISFERSPFSKRTTNGAAKDRSRIVSQSLKLEMLEDRLTPATHVWVGASGGIWSNGANWTNGAPTSSELGGTIVQFDGGITSTDDIPGLVVDQIHFTATGNTILGATTLGIDGLAATNNIVNDNGTNIVDPSLPINLSGASINVLVTAGTLGLNSNISGNQNLQLVDGSTAGVLVLGGFSNTYTGNTAVNDGTLSLNTLGVDTGIGTGSLIIGDTNGAPGTAIVKLAQSVVIPDTTNVSIASDGVLDMNFSTDTVGPLQMVGGSIVINGQGTLTVNGTLNMTGGTISGDSTLILGGDVVAIADPAANPARINTSVNLNTAGDRTFFVNSGPFAQDLVIGGKISGAGNFVKANVGTLQLTGNASNDFLGTTSVLSGALELNSTPGNEMIPNDLIIGDGIGAALSASVQIFQAAQIANTSNVTINSDGKFIALQASDTIGSLTVNEGTIDGTLSVVVAVNYNGSASDDTLNIAATGVSSATISYNQTTPWTLADTGSIAFNGADGSDTLTITNPNNTLYAPLLGITYDGGGQAGDALLNLGGGSSTNSNGFYTPNSSSSGTLSHTITVLTQTITFTGLTPVTDTVADATFTVNGTAFDEEINIVDGPIVGVQTTQVNSGASNTFELINFANKTAVTVNALDGTDTIVVNNPNAAAGLLNLTVDSEDGNDVVTVARTAAGVATTLNSSIGLGVTDNVTIGDAGLLTGILGSVTILNDEGSSNVTISDANDAVARNASIDTSTVGNQTFGRVTGLGNTGAILYRIAGTGDMNSVAILGGSGGNAFLIDQLAPGGTTFTTTISSGTGVDTVSIRSTSLNITYVIQGQQGSDTVVVGSAAPAVVGGNLNGISGQVDIRNTLGSTSLTIDDSGDTTARPGITLQTISNAGETFGVVAGLGNGAPIRYLMNPRQVSAVTLNGGSAGNTYALSQALGAAGAFTTTINMGSGSDTINLDTASANVTYALNGQAGNDQFNINANNATVTISDTAGNDALNFTNAVAAVTFNLGTNAGQAQVIGSGTSLSLTGAIESLGGSAFADTLTGSANADNIRGGAGADVINGLAGNDTILGEQGADTLNGGDGNDSIDGGTENDLLVGGDGLDTLVTGAGNDLAFGQGQADSIVGGAGNDSMDGGDDNDTITGDVGADYIVGGLGNDSLIGGDDNDGFDAGDGNDFIDGGLGNDFMYGFGGNDTMLGQDGADGMDAGLGADSVDGGAGNDFMYGLDGNDTMIGNDGDDGMDGGAGDDSMVGGLGNDLLFGNFGNDSESGGAGNDSLDGNGGNDTLDGGTENDLIFSSGGGNDLILGGAGNDTLQNIDAFATVFGGAGNDLLYGAAFGNDSLIGEDGNDTIFGLGGNDTITTGTGNDVVDGGTGTDVVTDTTASDTLFNVP